MVKEEGLYGAGQDLLKDAFTGNLHGLGPQVAEMEFEERPSEPFMILAADKDGARGLQPSPLPGLRRPHVLLGPPPFPGA